MSSGCGRQPIAPYLHEYFELIKQFSEETFDEILSMYVSVIIPQTALCESGAMSDGNGKGKGKGKDEAERKMETACLEFRMEHEKKEAVLKEAVKPLIEMSFKHHDSKGNGVLDKDEAAVFFAHLAAEQSAFAEVLVSLGIKHQMVTNLEQVKAKFADKSTDEVNKMLKEQGTDKESMEEVKKQQQERVKGMREDYEKNKAERDTAAFNVADVNGDGTLQLAETIAILTPGDPKNKAFLEALGFEVRPIA